MAYIQPNSTIEFFGDLNLSDNFDDTLYFPTVAAKDAYFTALPKLATAPTCTYTRENRGYVRVEIPMNTMIGANYMRFKNTSFENKWWYAFVKKVDYVNNLTTEVQFEIDPIMSWMGVFTLHDCFIERQHTLRDGIGNNICEEGIPFGEYIVEEQTSYPKPEGGETTSARIVIAYIPDDEVVSGSLNNNIYSPCSIHVCSSASEANDYINNLLQYYKIDNIVGVYMIWSSYLSSGGTGAKARTVDISKPYTDIDGYVPRNKKLFCYPYKMLRVDNMEGSFKEYMYEYFNSLPDVTSTGDCRLFFYCYANATAEAFIMPLYYKGQNELLSERITMTKFPQVAIATNSYEAYLAQKNSYFAQDVVRAGTKSFINGTGGAGSIVATSLNALAAMDAQALDTLILNEIRPLNSPMEMRGNQDSDSIFAYDGKHFLIQKMCITKNYAMMLDSYFDMFGYAVKQHGVPNMNARPNWTYVKTIGCVVGGNIPADDAGMIEDIFNHGVRFWKNHNNIGNYSLNNAPA